MAECPRIGRYRACAECAMSGRCHADYCSWAVHWQTSHASTPHLVRAQKSDNLSADGDEVTCSWCFDEVRKNVR